MISKKIQKATFLLTVFPVIGILTSFQSPNSTEFIDHNIDEHYSSSRIITPKYYDDNNLIPPDFFEKDTGVLTSTYELYIPSFEDYTFVLYIKDNTSLKQLKTKSDNNFYFSYITLGEAEHDILNFTIGGEDDTTPVDFFTYFQTKREDSFFIIQTEFDDDFSKIFIYIQSTFDRGRKELRILNMEFNFDCSNSAGIVSDFQLYKGKLKADYPGYAEYIRAPKGLSSNMVGPYKDQTEIDLTIPYQRENMMKVDDLKQTILAFDKYDYEYKQVSVKSDLYTNSTRNLNTKLPIVFQANDESNNVSTITFNIYVVDEECPKIEQISSNIKFSYKEKITSDIIATKFKITDNYSYKPSVEIEGIELNKNLEVGKYPITLKAYDSSNNYSSIQTSIEIIDDILPNISGPSYIQTSTSKYLSDEKIISQFKAIDEIDGELPISIDSSAYKSHYNIIGEYFITLNATDKSGNKIQRVISVNVSDTSGPVFYLDKLTITTYENETIEVESILNQLIDENVIEDANYISVEVQSKQNIELNNLKQGKYQITLACKKDTNDVVNIPLTIEVLQQKKEETNIFVQIYNFFRDLIKKILS